MKSKEKLIEEIDTKFRCVLENLSISELEKVIKELDKMIKKIKYVEKIISKIES